MPIFQVRQIKSGAILWVGAASDEGQALDAMAHEAGFMSASDLPAEVSGGGLRAETLRKSTASDGR